VKFILKAKRKWRKMNEKQRQRMMEMIEEGRHSNRKISRETGVNKNIVGKYKKVSVLCHQMKEGKITLPPREDTPSPYDHKSTEAQKTNTPRNKQPTTRRVHQIAENPYSPPQDSISSLLWELQQCRDKNNELMQKIKERTEERDRALEQVRDLTCQSHQKDKENIRINKEKEQLNQNNRDLTKTLDVVNHENQGLKDTKNKQRELLEKMKRDHHREVVELIHKANQEKTILQNEHDKYLLKTKDDVTTMGTIICDLKKKLHDVTDERDKYKSAVERLAREHENDLIKFVTVGGVVVGTTIGFCLWGKNKNQTLPIQIEEGKNTGTRCEIIPILEEATIQPDSNHTTSGGTLLQANIPGILCSGASPPTHG
jgi:hypothetical protein